MDITLEKKKILAEAMKKIIEKKKLGESLDSFEKKFVKKLREDKWIQKAIGKKGSLHKQLGVPEDKKIQGNKLKVKPGDSDKLKKRKILAKTLIKIGKKRKLGESLSENESQVLELVHEGLLSKSILVLLGYAVYNTIRLNYDACYKKANDLGIATKKGKLYLYKCRIEFYKAQILNLQKAKSRCKNQISSSLCEKKIDLYIKTRNTQMERLIRKLEKMEAMEKASKK